MPSKPLMRSRSVHLLLALVLFFLGYPFTELLDEPWASRLATTFVTAVLLAAVWWTADSRRHRVVGVLLGGPCLLMFWFRQELGTNFSTLWVVFFFYVIGRLLSRIMNPHTSIQDRMVTAMGVYLLASITFAYLHLKVYTIHPESYRVPGLIDTSAAGEGLLDMLYFSLVTMLTLGYGDIVPVGGFAKMLAVMEAFFGTFFIAILVARLVSQRPVPGDTSGSADPSASPRDPSA